MHHGSNRKRWTAMLASEGNKPTWTHVHTDRHRHIQRHRHEQRSHRSLSSMHHPLAQTEKHAHACSISIPFIERNMVQGTRGNAHTQTPHMHMQSQAGHACSNMCCNVCVCVCVCVRESESITDGDRSNDTHFLAPHPFFR